MTIYEKHIKLQNEHIELLKQFKEQEDVINELKNTIERQEIMIDKMKSCYNCKNVYYEDDAYCRLTNKEACFCKNWELKED